MERMGKQNTYGARQMTLRERFLSPRRNREFPEAVDFGLQYPNGDAGFKEVGIATTWSPAVPILHTALNGV